MHFGKGQGYHAYGISGDPVFGHHAGRGEQELVLLVQATAQLCRLCKAVYSYIILLCQEQGQVLHGQVRELLLLIIIVTALDAVDVLRL
ncbi:hypothetical protein D3C72_879180 [compost metagenome]